MRWGADYNFPISTTPINWQRSSFLSLLISLLISDWKYTSLMMITFFWKCSKASSKISGAICYSLVSFSYINIFGFVLQMKICVDLITKLMEDSRQSLKEVLRTTSTKEKQKKNNSGDYLHRTVQAVSSRALAYFTFSSAVYKLPHSSPPSSPLIPFCTHPTPLAVCIGKSNHDSCSWRMFTFLTSEIESYREEVNLIIDTIKPDPDQRHFIFLCRVISVFNEIVHVFDHNKPLA